uniref:Uncharacterized protein n=1 Tax=Oryza sativa subsp. japonica TaxID=39947 RepID=Q651J9_ORYSJ|nr:hypothetical protein [Oryza sativa Japonica Group]BAD46518.1 hypothetical protein [Oryza sativa Japonica Group]
MLPSISLLTLCSLPPSHPPSHPFHIWYYQRCILRLLSPSALATTVSLNIHQIQLDLDI